MPRNPNKTDYSGGNGKRHFGSVLFMCATGLLCGMNSFADIEDFAKLRTDRFKKRISLPNGAPRAQSFSNIFQLMDPEIFSRRHALLDADYREQLLSLA